MIRRNRIASVGMVALVMIPILVFAKGIQAGGRELPAATNSFVQQKIEDA